MLWSIGNRRWTPLLAILILAAALRLWGLPNQPVLYFDSGQYLGEARYLASAARAAAHGLLQADASAPANPVARMVQGAATGARAHPPDNAKVGHSLLLAASMLVFGESTFAAALVSAVAGIGAVAVTYALGALGWGRRIAIVAALLLAISGEHLTYSREPYAEADTLLFAALGCLIYLRAVHASAGGGTWRRLLAVGSLFGLAFACNSRASYLPLVLVPTELAVWQARGWRCWRPTAVRALAVGVGLALPLALIEAGYLLARLLGRSFGATTAFPDYVQQVAAYWQQHPVTIRFDQWPTGLVDLALLDGLPVVLLLLAGLIWTLLRRRWQRPDLLLLGALVLPLVLYSVYVAGVARMRPFSLALPWMMIAAALGLDALARGLDRLLRRPALPALTGAATAALVLSALPRVADLVTAPSGMPGLLAYLATADVHDVASTDGAVLSFWVGEDHTNAKFRAAYISSPDDLDALSARYRVLAVDMQGYLFPNELAERYAETQPLFAVPHGSGMWYLASILEHRGVGWGEWDRVLDDWERYRAPATQLRVEDLRILANRSQPPD